MEKTNYFEIIHRYIAEENLLMYRIFLTHAILVTQKALSIARKLKLSPEKLIFIEEAAMMHDIGIVRVNAPEIGCKGDQPYLYHGIEGRKILEKEGLKPHALVCERHLGVGITRNEIIENSLDLPHRDMIPTTIEEKIICFADLFYSKSPEKLWIPKSIHDIKKSVIKYGERQLVVFKEWTVLFEG
jgi:uncharacterized protein